VQAVTVIMGIVVGLTFLFGFGNVLNLALRLGVSAWIAPLVAPAVDLSVIGLLLGTRHLALSGASQDVLRPARRLLTFASMVTLALNVAEPLVAGEFGKAAFDAVGPLLLIGWSEVGPGLLQAIGATSPVPVECDLKQDPAVSANSEKSAPAVQPRHNAGISRQGGEQAGSSRIPDDLLAKARQEDTAHRAAHQKPISADTLRTRLGVGTARARQLTKIVRAEFGKQLAAQQTTDHAADEKQDAVVMAA
jgi:hypothetical protein